MKVYIVMGGCPYDDHIIAVCGSAKDAAERVTKGNRECRGLDAYFEEWPVSGDGLLKKESQITLQEDDSVEEVGSTEGMSYEEASSRVEQQANMQTGEIKMVLNMASAALHKKAVAEEYIPKMKEGDPIWHIDFVAKEIEKGVVCDIWRVDGCINSFSVLFENDECLSWYKDEFNTNVIGEVLFPNEEMARMSLGKISFKEAVDKIEQQAKMHEGELRMALDMACSFFRKKS